MANLKEVRTRISSTISTQQITKAMKLVSATKLKKAQNAILQMRPYAEKLQSILANLSSSADDMDLKVYFKPRPLKNVLIIVITSDRGLCGPFNANVIKTTSSVINLMFKDLNPKNIHLKFMGKKGFDYFKSSAFQLDTVHKEIFSELTSENVFNVGDEIINDFKSGKYDEVRVVYNQFKNAATQIIMDERVLPVDLSHLVQGKQAVSNDYVFEPGKAEILQELIPRAVKTQLFKCLLDSNASEHGARMVAMDKATENAGELLKSLRLQYNQARQAAITTEISEIVGGAAAMSEA
ncbi:MAG: ATP synthase F1 subunit gamma [Flavobacteriales bacterium]|nr:ATP synthase F1 subunit gamma [Flavobacteriales bacterium]